MIWWNFEDHLIIPPFFRFCLQGVIEGFLSEKVE